MLGSTAWEAKGSVEFAFPAVPLNNSQQCVLVDSIPLVNQDVLIFLTRTMKL